MTLETVPRYDAAGVSESGDRAVVIGASVAGLAAARVLADGFEAVTVVERDSLPEAPATRRGVPQGNHVHTLLEAGRATFEDLFPGYGEEVLSTGGLLVDGMSDFNHYEKGGFLADGATRMPMYCGSRPLFEHVLRRRVAALDGVEIRAAHQFTGYRTDDDAVSVDGVRIRSGDADEVELEADLVVDATGRTSKTPTWLDEHGYAAPPVDEVTIDVAYSTVVIERPVEDRQMFFVPPDPPRTRATGVFPIEDGRRLVTLVGVHGDHPPTDRDGLLEFASSLPIPHIAEMLETQPWVSDEVAHYPFPSNRRRRYEDLDRFPEGLVVVGDAICSFNPIYGQGMSVAALEALVLHHTLAAGDEAGLGRRYFDRIEAIVDVPWSIAVGSDFKFPETTGPKPRGTDLLNRYLGRLIRTAHTDSTVREALYRTFTMEREPESLFHPGIVWRVLKPSRSATGSTTSASKHRPAKPS